MKQDSNQQPNQQSQHPNEDLKQPSEQANEQFADQFKIHTLLGQGGQASVYLGSKNNQLYALKLYFPGFQKIEAFKVEVNFLGKLNYKHLINMVDHRLQAKVKIRGKKPQIRPMIVIELADGGQLFEYIEKEGRFVAEACRSYFKQIISAIKYLHGQEVTHRDLKPENILFDKDFTLKVSDFGLSRDSKGQFGDFKLKEKLGTPGYKPPEMEQGNYTGLDADLFAAGVILFVMYSGHQPFISTKANDRLYSQIRTNNFTSFWTLHQKNKKQPNFYPDQFKRLINSMFSYQKDRRPTFEHLQTNAWLNGDEYMGNQLYKYMKEKADNIAVNDPNKQLIADLRNQFLQKIKKGECDHRGDDDQDISGLSIEEIFARNYFKYQINIKDLPQYQKNKIMYISQNPAFLIAWLENYLIERRKENQIFMKNSIWEIEPVRYQIELQENNKLNVNFIFLIEKEDQIELKLRGQIHKNFENKVGINWIKVEGEPFWLTSIIRRLNQQVQKLV